MSVDQELQEVPPSDSTDPATVHYGQGYHKLPQEEPVSPPYVGALLAPSSPYAPGPQSFAIPQSSSSNTVSSVCMYVLRVCAGMWCVCVYVYKKGDRARERAQPASTAKGLLVGLTMMFAT